MRALRPAAATTHPSRGRRESIARGRLPGRRARQHSRKTINAKTHRFTLQQAHTTKEMQSSRSRDESTVTLAIKNLTRDSNSNLHNHELT